MLDNGQCRTMISRRRQAKEEGPVTASGLPERRCQARAQGRKEEGQVKLVSLTELRMQNLEFRKMEQLNLGGKMMKKRRSQRNMQRYGEAWPLT